MPKKPKKLLIKPMFRLLPIYSDLKSILDNFGVEAVSVLITIRFLLFASLVGWVAFTAFNFLLFIQRYFVIESIFSSSQILLVDFLQRTPFRAAIWFAIILQFFYVINSAKLIRDVTFNHKLGYTRQLQNFSFLLRNVDKLSSNQEINDVITRVTEQSPIKISRIKSVHSIRYFQILTDLEKEYYERIKEDVTGFIAPRQPMLLKRVRRMKLLPVFQFFGQFRDESYYNKQIAVLKSKIEKAQAKAHETQDYLIITFQNQRVRDFTLKKLKRSKIFDYQIEEIFAPEDIKYKNINQKVLSIKLKQLFSYAVIIFASIAMFAVNIFFRLAYHSATKEVTYYVVHILSFVLMYTVELILQYPILLSTKLEKHKSLNEEIAVTMRKNYTFQLLNRIFYIYSIKVIENVNFYRQLNNFSQLYGFFDIFTLYDSNTTMKFDVYHLMWSGTIVTCLLDVIYQCIVKDLTKRCANTYYHLQRSENGTTLNYSRVHVQIALELFIALAFSHQNPELMLLFILSLCFHSFSFRIQQIKLSKPAVESRILYQSSAELYCISCIFGAVFLALDYYDKLYIYLPIFLLLTVLLTVLTCKLSNSSIFAKLFVFFNKLAPIEVQVLAREAEYGKTLADIVESDVRFKSNEELFAVPERKELDKKLRQAISKQRRCYNIGSSFSIDYSADTDENRHTNLLGQEVAVEQDDARDQQQ